MGTTLFEKKIKQIGTAVLQQCPKARFRLQTCTLYLPRVFERANAQSACRLQQSANQLPFLFALQRAAERIVRFFVLLYAFIYMYIYVKDDFKIYPLKLPFTQLISEIKSSNLVDRIFDYQSLKLLLFKILWIKRKIEKHCYETNCSFTINNCVINKIQIRSKEFAKSPT